MINKTSQLGFGCASVMGKKGRSESLFALNHAYELGISHFDIARSYGFGQAESLLGEFIQDKRDSVTVTSKFGVIPPSLGWKKKILIPVARSIYERIPSLKKNITKKSGEVLAKKNFDLNYAKECIDKSLKDLGTDYIDFYLLHEPDVDSLTNKDELFHFLETIKEEGKIRSFGAAIHQAKDINFFSSFGDCIQYEGNINTFNSYMNVNLKNNFSNQFITRPFIGGNINLVNSLVTLFNQKYDLSISVVDFSIALSLSMASAESTLINAMFSKEHIEENISSFNKITNDSSLQLLVKEFVLKNQKGNL